MRHFAVRRIRFGGMIGRRSRHPLADPAQRPAQPSAPMPTPVDHESTNDPQTVSSEDERTGPVTVLDLPRLLRGPPSTRSAYTHLGMVAEMHHEARVVHRPAAPALTRRRAGGCLLRDERGVHWSAFRRCSHPRLEGLAKGAEIRNVPGAVGGLIHPAGQRATFRAALEQVDPVGDERRRPSEATGSGGFVTVDDSDRERCASQADAIKSASQQRGGCITPRTSRDHEHLNIHTCIMTRGVSLLRADQSSAHPRLTAEVARGFEGSS